MAGNYEDSLSLSLSVLKLNKILTLRACLTTGNGIAPRLRYIFGAFFTMFSGYGVAVETVN